MQQLVLSEYLAQENRVFQKSTGFSHNFLKIVKKRFTNHAFQKNVAYQSYYMLLPKNQQ